MAPIIDSDVHLMSYRPEEYPWVTTDMSALRADFLPVQLQPLMESVGVAGCVTVQARQSTTETDWLLGLGARHRFILAVVGWVNLMAPDLEVQLDRWIDQPLLKGFRHVVIDEMDPNFLLRDEVVAGIRVLGRRGYTYDLLVLPQQLPDAAALVGQLSDQQFVLDHAGLPDIRRGQRSQWAAALLGVAEKSNASMKLSALDFCADWRDWKPADLEPYLQTALETLSALQAFVGTLSRSEQAQIHRGCLTRVYSI